MSSDSECDYEEEDYSDNSDYVGDFYESEELDTHDQQCDEQQHFDESTRQCQHTDEHGEHERVDVDQNYRTRCESDSSDDDDDDFRQSQTVHCHMQFHNEQQCFFNH